MDINKYIITEACISDCKEILSLQKLCYIQEAEIYQDYSIQPLSQTIEDIENEFHKCVLLKCVYGESIIGSVRAFSTDSTCYIGKLIVHSDFQNIGIGKELMKQIEKRFSDSKRFELFTGSESIKNISLYQKIGYSIFKRDKLKPSIELVFLEKTNSGL